MPQRLLVVHNPHQLKAAVPAEGSVASGVMSGGGSRYTAFHKVAISKPVIPQTKNAVFQLNDKVSQAISGGAMIAPIELPATHKLFAVARTRPENQMVTVFSCAGKLAGSATPSIPRKNPNCPTVDRK